MKKTSKNVQAYGLLSLCIAGIAGGWFMVHTLGPSFCNETVGVIGSTVFWFIVWRGYRPLRYASDCDLSHSDDRLETVLLALAGGMFLLCVAHITNRERNPFLPVLAIASTCAFAITVISVMTAYRNTSTRERIGAIAVSSSVIIILKECYVHAGTQFVWVPVLVYAAVFLSQRLLFGKPLRMDRGIAKTCGIVPIGIASTLWQFRSERIFGLPPWGLFLGIVGAFIFFIWLFMTFEEKEKEREKARSLALQQDKEENLRAVIEKVGVGTSFDCWEDILDVYFLCGKDLRQFPFLRFLIEAEPLESLVSISERKQQIFFDGKLEDVMLFLEKATGALHEDADLEKIENLMRHFHERVVPVKMFKGYEPLRIMIEKRFPSSLLFVHFPE